MLKELFAVRNYTNLEDDGKFFYKVLRLLETYGFLICALIAVSPVLMLADKFVTGVLHHHSLDAENRQLFQRYFHKIGFLNSILLVGIIGPVFEEMIFRFWLSFTKRQIAVSALVTLVYFGSLLFHAQNIMLKTIAEIGLAGIVFGVCYTFVPNQPLNISLQRKNMFIILSIALFGLMHIFNYRPLDWPLFWIYPIYVIPQLLMGLGNTYLRLKNGFAWGLAMHCLINIVSTLLIFAFMK